MLQQGNLVVHRAKGLRKAGERITMVNGYVPHDITFPDFSHFDQLYMVEPKGAAASEYARHMTWMARERMTAELDAFEFSEDKDAMVARLNAFAAHLTKVADGLRDVGDAQTEHFGDG